MAEMDGQTEIERKLAEQEAAEASRREIEKQAWPPEPGAPMTTEQARIVEPPRRRSLLEQWKDRGGVLGGLAAAVIFVLKVVAPVLSLLVKFLFVFKTVLITFGSMALSMWFYSTRFGWAFAVGIVLLIFVHESGHATASRIKGLKVGPMVFVPFMGAFVTSSGVSRTLEMDAFIGIMGPVFGTIAGIVCVILGFVTHQPVFFGLAYFNFFMNLFNLTPAVPLDGAWIAPLFSPKLLAFGAVLMLFLGFMNPLIWILGLLSLPRVIAGWKADPATQPYYRVSNAARWKYGFAYLGLIALLAFGMVVTHIA
ncbi:MAG: hypothetical protein P4L33_17720 [Capsulimonadaceae bacterium]|nr:hypothetical protein [Capsulimonadaceae bacterium]